MPYISPVTDRPELNPFIDALVEKMREVKTESELYGLRNELKPLAEKIKEVSEKHGYYGAFAGELNYTSHRILFGMLPDVRYWIIALTTGWLTRLTIRFGLFPFNRALAEYRNRRPHLSTVRKENLFKHVAAWAIVELSALVAPDDSEDASDIILGVLKNIDAELYDRLWSEYEEMMRKKHGDLPEYIFWLEKMHRK